MANRSLGTLTLDLIAKTGGFTAGLDKAGREAEKKLKDLESKAYAVGKNIGAGLAVIGTAAVAGATYAATEIRRVINDLDDLSKSAAKAGVSTEVFSTLVYAGQLADVEMESLVGTFGKLIKNQAAAAQGSDNIAEAFDRLGIAYKDANGNLRDSVQVLYDFADAFKENEGSPEVMALGFQIFGKSFQDIIPLISSGSEGLKEAADEAERFGYVVSAEAAASAEEFNDNLTRLELAADGVWRTIAADLLPDLVVLSNNLVSTAGDSGVLTDAIDILRVSIDAIGVAFNVVQIAFAGFKAGLQAATQVALGAAEAITAAYSVIANANPVGLVTGKLQASLTALPKQVQQSYNMSVASLTQIGAKYQQSVARDVTDTWSILDGSRRRQAQAEAKRLAAERMEHDALQRKIARGIQLSEDGGKKRAVASKAAKQALTDEQREAQRLQETYQDMTRDLERRIALAGDRSEIAGLKYDLERGKLKALADEQKKFLLAQTEAAVGAEKAAEKDKKARDQQADKLRDAASRMADVNKEYRQYLSDLQFELSLLGKSADEQERLDMLRRLGIDAASESAKVLSETLKVYQQQRAAVEDQVEAMDTLRSSFSSALSDWVKGTKSFKEAFMGMLDEINSRIIDQISQNFTDKLFGPQGSANSEAGGGEGFFSRLFGGLFGVKDKDTLAAEMPNSAGVQPYAEGVIVAMQTEAQRMADGVIQAASASLQQMAAAVSSNAQSSTFSVGETATTAQSSMESVAGTVSSDLQTTSTGFFGNLFSSFKGFFSNIGSWISQLFSSFGAGGGAGGGGAGGWLSFIGGLFGGGRANGGPVEAGGFYRVNESGPELLSVGSKQYLMMGAEAGRVTPNRSIGSAGVHQVNNFTVQGRIDRRTETQIALSVGQRSQVAQRRIV